MRVVMDSSEYLDMTILTIKRRDLGGYEEIATCNTCSCRRSWPTRSRSTTLTYKCWSPTSLQEIKP